MHCVICVIFFDIIGNQVYCQRLFVVVYRTHLNETVVGS